ncbi:hypothetical protein ACIO14_24805 [Nocardia fluminea]|uniref:hypothetical protein n=1 Tax=Nocardia fluminea TaxID=134984 RepID=UPI00381C550C
MLRIGIGGDLWWTLAEATVLHAALGELIGAESPLEAGGCLSWCIHHTVIEADALDPASLESLLHESAPMSVPSIQCCQDSADSDERSRLGGAADAQTMPSGVVYVRAAGDPQA